MSGALSIISTAASARVTITPPNSTGFDSGPYVVSSLVTATTAPDGPYTYIWSYVSGDASFQIFLSQGPTMRWYVDGLAPGENRSATWKATAYLNGQSMASQNVNITMSRLG